MPSATKLSLAGLAAAGTLLVAGACSSDTQGAPSTPKGTTVNNPHKIKGKTGNWDPALAKSGLGTQDNSILTARWYTVAKGTDLHRKGISDAKVSIEKNSGDYTKPGGLIDIDAGNDAHDGTLDLADGTPSTGDGTKQVRLTGTGTFNVAGKATINDKGKGHPYNNAPATTSTFEITQTAYTSTTSRPDIVNLTVADRFTIGDPKDRNAAQTTEVVTFNQKVPQSKIDDLKKAGWSFVDDSAAKSMGDPAQGSAGNSRTSTRTAAFGLAGMDSPEHLILDATVPVDQLFIDKAGTTRGVDTVAIDRETPTLTAPSLSSVAESIDRSRGDFTSAAPVSLGL